MEAGAPHSPSGTMAVSETALQETDLMTSAETNAEDGSTERPIEAVVVGPDSNWPLFAGKARQNVTQDKVLAAFGCWTSVSRKSVLPAFKGVSSILHYPVQYEGEESDKNILYKGVPLRTSGRLPQPST